MHYKERTQTISSFLQRIHGSREGFVYAPYLEEDKMHPQGFRNPSGRKQFAQAVSAYCEKWTSYYSPVLYKEMGSNAKSNFLCSKFLWIDVDGGQGERVLNNLSNGTPVPYPSIVVNSGSEGNVHLYWELDEWCDDIEVLERLNRGIKASIGVGDPGSWDAGQLLRPAGTFNHKRNRKASVKVAYDNAGVAYNLSSFPIDDTPANFAHVLNIDFDNLPDFEDVIKEYTLSHDVQSALTMMLPKDRSSKLYRIGHDLIEQTKMTDAEVFVILKERDDFWGKYGEKSPENQNKELTRIIEKARNKILKELRLAENFPVLTGHEMRVLNLIKPTYIFKNFIAERRLTTLFGDPSIGKTRFAMQMGICALLKQDFLGFEFNNDVTVRPAFLTMEMGVDMIGSYFENTIEPFTDEQQEILLNDFLFIPQIKETNLWDLKDQEALRDRLSEYHFNFLIIDSIMTSGGEGEHTLSYYNFANQIRHQFRCEVIFIAHNRKETQDTPRKVNRLSDLLGSQAHSARIDNVFAMDRVKNTPNIQVSNLKTRDGKLLEPFLIKDEDFWFSRLEEEKEAKTKDDSTGNPTIRLDI